MVRTAVEVPVLRRLDPPHVARVTRLHEIAPARALGPVRHHDDEGERRARGVGAGEELAEVSCRGETTDQHGAASAAGGRGSLTREGANQRGVEWRVGEVRAVVGAQRERRAARAEGRVHVDLRGWWGVSVRAMQRRRGEEDAGATTASLGVAGGGALTAAEQ